MLDHVDPQAEISLSNRRKLFAEEIAAVANLGTPGLVEALAVVPRENFLPPGPWKIPFADRDRFGALTYRLTADADPKHVCHNVLVALDAARELNNGHPSSLCAWIDALSLGGGSRVFHLGCGSGYFTALMASIVGNNGSILAAEIDETLGDLALRGLESYRQVDVRISDGMVLDPGPVDAILVNAGVTHAAPLWLDRLRPNGRMLLPLTYAPAGSTTSTGIMVLVCRSAEAFTVKTIGSVAIFTGQGGRSSILNERLRTMLPQGGWQRLQTIRRDPHDEDESCWLHVDGACFSMSRATA